VDFEVMVLRLQLEVLVDEVVDCLDEVVVECLEEVVVSPPYPGGAGAEVVVLPGTAETTPLRARMARMASCIGECILEAY
jgi:hypothetical protein